MRRELFCFFKKSHLISEKNKVIYMLLIVVQFVYPLPNMNITLEDPFQVQLSRFT